MRVTRNENCASAIVDNFEYLLAIIHALQVFSLAHRCVQYPVDWLNDGWS